jgi:inhibitor of cysteine peptidase
VRAGVLAGALLAGSSIALAAVQTVTVGEAYDGGTVHLAPGDALEVRLSAGSSGCSWEPAFGDPSVLKPEVPFRFRAVTTGSASLGLVCRQPSDLRARPGGLFRVLVVVKESVFPRVLLLEEPDNASEIYVVQGDVVQVRLPANPSTGYTWTVASNTPSILQPLGDPKFEPPAKPGPGGAGTQTFEFRVAGGGGAFLELAYARPFEKDGAPARRWGIFVACAGTGP